MIAFMVQQDVQSVIYIMHFYFINFVNIQCPGIIMKYFLAVILLQFINRSDKHFFDRFYFLNIKDPIRLCIGKKGCNILVRNYR